MTFSSAKVQERRGRREVLYIESRQGMAKSSRFPELGELLFTRTVGGKTPHARARAPAAYITGHIASLIGTHSINDGCLRAVIRLRDDVSRCVSLTSRLCRIDNPCGVSHGLEGAEIAGLGRKHDTSSEWQA